MLLRRRDRRSSFSSVDGTEGSVSVEGREYVEGRGERGEDGRMNGSELGAWG